MRTVVLKKRTKDDKIVGLQVAVPMDMASSIGFHPDDPLSIKPTEDGKGLVLRRLVEETLDPILAV